MYRTKLAKNKCDKYDFEVLLAGNPNVGKSTIFNSLTGLKQHTGNWSGKTVSNAVGYCNVKDNRIKVVDLPGTYSLMRGSPEEIIAMEYIKSSSAACAIVVIDATNIERNLNLVIQILNITQNVVVCVNLLDEALKKHINIDLDELSLQLGVPVVGTSARSKKGLNELKDVFLKVCQGKIKTFKVKKLEIKSSDTDTTNALIEKIYSICNDITDKCVTYNNAEYESSHKKIDKILTSKMTGIPVMLILLCILFWITAVGANYPSQMLIGLFNVIKKYFVELLYFLNFNKNIISFIIDGVYTTLTWVVSVMLPPMAIFFPIFSLLEDSGYLPRIAFNMDRCFSFSKSNGKQALTMMMGFGCNACGVMGCRIFDSKSSKNIAIMTNNFIPCNGRLPSLIAITSIFIAVTSSVLLNSFIVAVLLILMIIIAVFVTLIISKILSNTLYKGDKVSFVMEMPPYRRPQIVKTIIYSLKDRALFVLIRAVCVAIPAGAVIWLLSNIKISDISILSYCTSFLQPVGKMFGLDGVILMAFLLGFPANETVIPIILMSYLSTGMLTDYSGFNELSRILTANGWTIETGICFLILCMFHFPCSTTCLTIKKETNSIKMTLLSMVIPTLIGLTLCMVVHMIATTASYF